MGRKKQVYNQASITHTYRANVKLEVSETCIALLLTKDNPEKDNTVERTQQITRNEFNLSLPLDKMEKFIVDFGNLVSSYQEKKQ